MINFVSTVYYKNKSHPNAAADIVETQLRNHRFKHKTSVLDVCFVLSCAFLASCCLCSTFRFWLCTCVRVRVRVRACTSVCLVCVTVAFLQCISSFKSCQIALLKHSDTNC